MEANNEEAISTAVPISHSLGVDKGNPSSDPNESTVSDGENTNATIENSSVSENQSDSHNDDKKPDTDSASASGFVNGGRGQFELPQGSNVYREDRPRLESVRSTTSRSSMRPGVVKSDATASSYLCYKGERFENAVDKSKIVIKPELDGEFKSAWLLTEIDHWDCEHEKIIIITDFSMFIIRYNFAYNKLLEYRRILLHVISSITIGDFQYPSSSFMSNRKHGGIQIRWDEGRDTLTFGQKWNPWCDDIPWCTLAHHPLIYNRKENETITYNVDEFFETLLTQANKMFADKNPGKKLTVHESPIQLENYIGLTAMLFNQSSLGFTKDRNGAHF